MDDEKITVFHVRTHTTSRENYSRTSWERFLSWNDTQRKIFPSGIPEEWCTSPVGHIGYPCVFCGQKVDDNIYG